MQVSVYSPDDDPLSISGFTIVVDVLRAFSVSYFIHANNPDKYLVVDSVDHAFLLRRRIPDTILIGERNGIKIDGFDYGNSPTEVLGKNFAGQTVVHTTTAGTKGLLSQRADNQVVAGSFVNAGALINLITRRGIETVSIYCTAPKGIVHGEEDYYFAHYMKSMLMGIPVNFPDMVTALRVGTGRGFSDTGFAPYSDFERCMQLNRFNAILERKLISGDVNAVELVPLAVP